MRQLKVMAAGLAVAGMASTVPSVAFAAQGAGSSVGAASGQCEVVVKRNTAAGVFDLARYVAKNGKCYCLVSTGPRTQGGSAESAVAAIQVSRSCANAPLVGDAPGGGGLGSGFWIGLGVAGVAGLVAGLAGGGSDSP